MVYHFSFSLAFNLAVHKGTENLGRNLENTVNWVFVYRVISRLTDLDFSFSCNGDMYITLFYTCG